MIKFWQTLATQIKQEAPTATPIESKSSQNLHRQRRDYKKKEGDDGYGDEPPPVKSMKKSIRRICLSSFLLRGTRAKFHFQVSDDPNDLPPPPLKPADYDTR